MWDEDGDKVAGTFVRFDSGPTREYGVKPITVLLVNGEERSSLAPPRRRSSADSQDELQNRPSRNLTPGERVYITRKEKTNTADGSRSYHPYGVYFPDKPDAAPAELFGWSHRSRQGVCSGRTGWPSSARARAEGARLAPSASLLSLVERGAAHRLDRLGLVTIGCPVRLVGTGGSPARDPTARGSENIPAAALDLTTATSDAETVADLVDILARCEHRPALRRPDRPRCRRRRGRGLARASRARARTLA